MEALGPILVVEDDLAVAAAIELALRAAGGATERVDGLSALNAIALGDRFAAAVLDMNFSAGARDGSEGLQAVELIRRKDPALAIVVLTVNGGVALAVQALQRGACDFLLKPWRNAKLVEAVQSAAALTRKQRASEARSLEEIERQAIVSVLDRHQGSISKAAITLGLTRPALYRRLEKYGL